MRWRTLWVGCAIVAIIPVRFGSKSAYHGVKPYSELQAKHGWRLRSYNFGGASVDFMLRYPDALSKGLGGPAVVLKNPTFRCLVDLSAAHSTPFNRDEFGERGGFYDYASTSLKPTMSATSFTGKPFFVGDANEGAGMGPSPKSSVEDLKEILRGGPGWRMTVARQGGADPSEVGMVTFWHSADSASLTRLPQEDDANAKRLAKFLRQVGGDTLPFGFFLVSHSATLQGCGPLEFSDMAYPRYINVKVAVIENNSAGTLRIGGFEGAENAVKALRLSTADDRRRSGPAKGIAWGGELSLAAGERLVIPLKIDFTYHDYSYASGSSGALDVLKKPPVRQDVQHFLDEFDKKWKGLDFDLNEDRKGDAPAKNFPKTFIRRSTMVKLAQRPWRDPHVNEDFVYGPSFRLTGVHVETESRPAVLPKSQSLDYTTANGFGSCPYVSIWDSGRGLWLDEGRVLIGAVGVESARSESYAVSSVPSQIAVAEREPEATHLTGLSVEVDGVSTEPIEGLQDVITEGERRVYHFDVPQELRGRPATLHVSGYYVRLPRLRFGSQRSHP